MRRRLDVHLTLDIDPDGATGAAPTRDELEWQGLNLLPSIRRAAAERGIPITAFVRCDLQIQDLYGDPLAIRDQCAAELDRIEQDGGEVGWHPHLYRRTETGGYQPLRDGPVAAAQLREIHSKARGAGFHAVSVRLGEAWHSTECMRALDDLGILLDSTAIPGRRRDDPVLSFDWEATPNQPYHPDRSDHRVPGKDPLALLEVPMSSAPVQAAHDRAPLRRYIDPAFHPNLFEQGVRGFFDERRNEEVTTLVLVLHPGELVPGIPNGLCAQSFEAFERNLDFLVSTARGGPGQIRFLPLKRALDDRA